MSRTTLDIDPSVLQELRRRQQSEHKTLGRMVSELLVQAMAADPQPRPPVKPWISRPMAARVDLEDKDALYAALDRQ